MALDNRSDHGKPDAQPARVPRAAVVQAREPFEDALAVGGFDARAVILHHQNHIAGTLSFGAQRDANGAVGVPPSVVEQVAHDPRELLVAASDAPGRHGISHQLRPIEAHSCDLLEHDVVEVHDGGRKFGLPFVGQIEQVGDNQFHPFVLCEHASHYLRPVCGVRMCECDLARRADRRHRRSQLM